MKVRKGEGLKVPIRQPADAGFPLRQLADRQSVAALRPALQTGPFSASWRTGKIKGSQDKGRGL